MVSGPRRQEDEDGPEEFRLIIVDNGRSRMLADPHLRAATYSICCGPCLHSHDIERHVRGARELGDQQREARDRATSSGPRESGRGTPMG